ncbi:MAG: triacylglycerol lipase [Rhizobium sp.]|nr:triacylglycerol lipase [Rhizobium sp.]
MAKVLYTDELIDHENLGSFDTTSFKLKSATEEKMTFVDDSGARMVLEGTGIEKEDGKVTDGEITSAKFYNAAGDKIYTFKDVAASAADIYTAYSFDHVPNRVMHGLMSGNDEVTGSKFDDSLWGFYGDDVLKGRLGDDFMYGHQGNDTLTGGEGSDSFALTAGTNHDTATDFNVKGENHDLIYMDYYLYDSLTYTKDGKDVTLTLETGDQLTLENVRKSQLTVDHFDFF